MKKLNKRVLALLTVCAMACTMFAGMPASAFADTASDSDFTVKVRYVKSDIAVSDWTKVTAVDYTEITLSSYSDSQFKVMASTFPATNRYHWFKGEKTSGAVTTPANWTCMQATKGVEMSELMDGAGLDTDDVEALGTNTMADGVRSLYGKFLYINKAAGINRLTATGYYYPNAMLSDKGAPSEVDRIAVKPIIATNYGEYTLYADGTNEDDTLSDLVIPTTEKSIDSLSSGYRVFIGSTDPSDVAGNRSASAVCDLVAYDYYDFKVALKLGNTVLDTLYLEGTDTVTMPTTLADGTKVAYWTFGGKKYQPGSEYSAEEFMVFVDDTPVDVELTAVDAVGDIGGKTTDNSPKTGDAENLMMWAVLLAAAAGATTVIIRRREVK